MGNRLSKIYTRTGDDGTTGLGDGSRIGKTDARVEAYGAVDEANSAIGVVLTHPSVPERVLTPLQKIQHELFDLGGELAVPGMRLILDEHVMRLEQVLDELNEELPPLKEFILPGGGPAAASCHLARAITRRAERATWALAAKASVASEVTRYLNRLSDLLFVMARILSRTEHGAEVLWVSTKNR